MKRTLIVIAASLLARPAGADSLIFDDLIIDGSICSGIDCVNGENFSFDTMILKENNMRILFLDTSSTSSFPSTDWRFVMNDSANGGLNHFTIENASTGVRPFAIFDNAPPQALVIDAGGIGLGIDPQRSLHVGAPDTPTIRIEQTALLGWAEQVWDVGANESNFFVRDSTSGTLPLRILPAPLDNTLVIATLGRVGIGTEVPSGTLHVQSSADFDLSDASAGQLLVDNVFAADAVMLNVRNNGAVYNYYEDTATGTRWEESFGPDPQGGGGRAWVLREAAGVEAVAVTHDGQMRIAGTLAQGSSRETKHRIEPVRTRDVLSSLSRLEISRWQYRDDAAGAEHMGPMAEDFHGAFGLGADDKHISPGDMAAVALSSLQEMDRRSQAQSEEIERLRGQVSSLEQRLEQLEALISSR